MLQNSFLFSKNAKKHKKLKIKGNNEVFEVCGSDKIGCDYLEKIQTASEDMLKERAMNSSNSNFIIMQHFPSEAKRLATEFTTNRKDSSKDITWSVYGHDHEQQCDESQSTDAFAESTCSMIRSGGGGNISNLNLVFFLLNFLFSLFSFVICVFV